MGKIHIIVATTAVNRPTLHADVLPNWIQWINALNKTIFEIHWFINIDLIKSLPHTFEETKREFIQLINHSNITPHILTCDGDTGNFLKACQRLSSNIEEFINKQTNINIPDTKIIWLEDDWKLNPSIIIPITDILATYSSKMSYINLSFIRNNYLHALAPSIISYPLWKSLHYEAWKNQGEKNIDPEHCVGKFYLATREKYCRAHNITVINKAIKPAYFTQPFLNCEHSYYTFHSDKPTAIKKEELTNRYIQKNEILQRIENIETFVRISPGACSDCGREFLEKKNIFKNKNGSSDFYSERI